ncbi:MAG: hypothetical protein WB715_07470 [Roseiarcus sp.]|uniref:hypothetical protein n=1 Tax=Roseiarcus sp. TaxID=1969460 RepID=UPI003C319C96
MANPGENTGTEELRARIRNVSVTAIATIIGAVLALVGVYITGWFTYVSKDEELRVHLVEIAIGILRADPKEDVAPARSWAIDIIDLYSGVKFLPQDRAALLHKPIKTLEFSGDFNSDFVAAAKALDEILRKDVDNSSGRPAKETFDKNVPTAPPPKP